MRAILLISLLLLASCNPCRYVSRHNECFRPDTVRSFERVEIKDTMFLTNDSIVYTDVPCNPSEVVKFETKYITKWKVRTETNVKTEYVDRINPVNETLKKEKDKAVTKLASVVTQRNIITLLLLAVTVFCLIRRFVFRSF